MPTANDGDADPSSRIDRLARRPFLRRTAGVVCGGLTVTTLAKPAAAGMIVELDVKANINLEGNDVIPAVVHVAEGDAPCFLPVADNVVMGPRFGPARLFECDAQDDPPGDPVQPFQQDDDLCALERAIQNDDGATPAHGDGHQQDGTSVMFHFHTQEAGFVPEDIGDNGTLDVTLSYAVEEGGDVEAIVVTDQVKGVAPMF